jgi:hypothetical protein
VRPRASHIPLCLPDGETRSAALLRAERRALAEVNLSVKAHASRAPDTIDNCYCCHCAAMSMQIRLHAAWRCDYLCRTRRMGTRLAARARDARRQDTAHRRIRRWQR